MICSEHRKIFPPSWCIGHRPCSLPGFVNHPWRGLLALSGLISVGVGCGLTYWLLLALFQGVSSHTLHEHSRIVPNQGIWNSLRNSVILVSLSMLVSGFAYVLSVLLRWELEMLLTFWLAPDIARGNPVQVGSVNY